MPNFDLLDLATILRRIGRGVVMYGHDGTGTAPYYNAVAWDGVSPLQLAHLGDTEGEIVLNPNGTIAPLQLPEISGEAIYEADYLGPNPELTIPLFDTDPRVLTIVSPVGQLGDGFTRVSPAEERTLVVFPERLFKDPASRGFGRISYSTATGWQFSPPDGAGGYGAPQALTAAQLTLLDLTAWLPRGYFDPIPRRFRGGHGNDSKNIETLTFHVMRHPEMPDGFRSYFYGDPADRGIDIDPVS